MNEHITIKKPPIPAAEPIAFSNSIRLTGQQWLGITLFAVVVVLVSSTIWKQFEAFPLEPDYRMPHDLSQDYWLYERYVDLAVQRYDTAVIGDSVIWGEFVKRDETLPHYLNKQAGTERFANLGLDGAHPLALGGLVEHFAASVRNMNVVLECNPLWLSSLQADLRDDKRVNQFNHPKLVPQFIRHIPSYQDEISPRLSILVGQRLSFNKWTNHLQQAYYKQNDIPTWTLEHPYDNPLGPLTRGLPATDETLRHLQLPWFKTGKTKAGFAWVEMDESLQWQAFQNVVDLLQSRGNRVFVLVGPFNEHMLTPASKSRYEKVKGTITAWLTANDIPHLAPAALPSDLYADVSHPLAAGYQLLARQLLDDPTFRTALAP